MTSRRLCALALAAPPVAACGDAGESTGAGVSVGQVTSTDGAEVTTTQVTVPPSTSTTVLAGTEQSGETADDDFCTDYGSSNVVDQDLSLVDPKIDELLAEGVAQLDDLRSRAPTEIAADVDTVYDGMVLMEDIFARHDYDMTAIPEDERNSSRTRTLPPPHSGSPTTAVWASESARIELAPRSASACLGWSVLSRSVRILR